MKESKRNYDDLVKRIKSGKDVSFGQMEEVFAQGFLSRFLQRISLDSEQGKFEQFYRERLSEEPVDEYGDPIKLSSDQLAEHDLETARMVIGTLGVRPSVDDLSGFVGKALRSRNWNMLDKVLSLTSEGTLQPGVIEKVALDDLVRGGYGERSYHDLREHFGELNFTHELVTPVYQTAISQREFEGLERVKKETRIPIPGEVCQTGYESFAQQGDIQNLSRLQGIAEVSPKKTSQIKEALTQLATTKDLSSEDIRELNRLFEIYPDSRLTKTLQLALLENKHLRGFFDLYKNSDTKLTEAELRKAYRELDQKDGIPEIITTSLETGVAPTNSLLRKTYGTLLKEKRFDVMRDLSDRTGATPVFDQNFLSSQLEVMVSTGNLRDFEETSGILRLSGKDVDSDHVHAVCENYLFVSSENDPDEVDKTYESHGLQPSKKATGVSVLRLMNFLGRDIREKERELKHSGWGRDRSPYEPQKGTNVSEYNKFKGAVNRLVNNYTGQISKRIKQNAECTPEYLRELQETAVSDPNVRGIMLRRELEGIQETYTLGLELMLLQSLRGEKSLVKLDKLSEASGIQISSDVVEQAVTSHVRRAVESGEEYSSEQISNVLSDVKERALPISLEGTLRENVASRLMQHITGSESKLSGYLNYLTTLTGNSKFNPETQESIRQRGIKELAKGRADEYDSLVGFLEKGPSFTDDEKAILKRAALNHLRERYAKTSAFDGIVSRAGIKVKATPQEAQEIFQKYFESPWNNKPSELGSRIDTNPDEEMITDRYTKLLAGEFEGYRFRDFEDRLKYIKDLKEDTGINLPNHTVRGFLDRTNEHRRAGMLRTLSPLFDFKYAPSELQVRYESALESRNHRLLNALLDTQQVAPSADTAKKLMQETMKETRSWQRREPNEFIAKLTHNYGISTPETIAQEIKSRSMRFPGNRNYDLIESLHELDTVYNAAGALSEDEAKQITSRVDDEFVNRPYDQNRKGTNTQDISYVYRMAGAQDRATRLAENLFNEVETTDENSKPRALFTSYAYCAISGAKPNLPYQRFSKIREDLNNAGKYRYVFQTEQKEQFKQMLTNWMGGNENA